MNEKLLQNSDVVAQAQAQALVCVVYNHKMIAYMPCTDWLSSYCNHNLIVIVK